jgi:hypothetical protein
MVPWFVRGLRKGIVTTRYPATVDVWTRDLPTPPAFHSRRLTAAMADRLVDGCPAGALERDGAELVVDLGRCTGCGRCIESGGDTVSRSGAFLLASTNREALIKRVPIRGGQE